MASKLPPKNVFSFIELRKRCPKNQIHHLEIFFAKHQQYQERLKKLKKDPPIIDWDFYKRNVRSECVPMVEEFEKQYANFCVPYPEDKYSKQIDKLKADLKVEIAEFIKKSNERIAVYESKMKKIRCMLPYDQMTWEDYCILYPEEAPDFLNRPTFWPHNEEEQIGYVEKCEDTQENPGKDFNKGK